MKSVFSIFLCLIPFLLAAQQNSSYDEYTFNLSQEIILKESYFLDLFDYDQESYDTINTLAQNLEEECIQLIETYLGPNIGTHTFSGSSSNTSFNPNDSVSAVLEYGIQVQSQYIFRVAAKDGFSRIQVYLITTQAEPGESVPSTILQYFSYLMDGLNSNGFLNVYNQGNNHEVAAVKQIQSLAHTGESNLYFTIDTLVSYLENLPIDERNRLFELLNERIY